MSSARLTLAYEIPSATLAERGDAEHRLLRVIGARVAMALPDLSTERAEAVHALNDAGMPVVAIPMGAPALCHADAVAVGSTGGGDPGDGPEVPVVGWEELSRALLVARRCTTDITIHSLEPSTSCPALADALVSARREELDARAAAGRVVDGHGDLRVEHVRPARDGVTVVDRLEFDACLRHVADAEAAAGGPRRALRWLETAVGIAGTLPPEYVDKRRRWKVSLARRAAYLTSLPTRVCRRGPWARPARRGAR